MMESRSNLWWPMNHGSIWPCQNISSMYNSGNGKLKGFRPLQSNKNKNVDLSCPVLFSEKQTKAHKYEAWSRDVYRMNAMKYSSWERNCFLSVVWAFAIDGLLVCYFFCFVLFFFLKSVIWGKVAENQARGDALWVRVLDSQPRVLSFLQDVFFTVKYANTEYSWDGSYICPYSNRRMFLLEKHQEEKKQNTNRVRRAFSLLRHKRYAVVPYILHV